MSKSFFCAILRHANEMRDQEWDPENKITPMFRLAELAGETGEACNVVKKLEREKLGLVGSRASVQDLADELADVIICVDLMMLEYDIDMVDAVTNKFNKTSIKNGLKTKIIDCGVPD